MCARWHEGRHHARQDDRQCADRHRRGTVEGAPAPLRRNQAGRRARQQDAQVQADHDVAEHAPAPVIARQAPGQRNQHLNNGRRESDSECGQHQHLPAVCHGGQRQRRHRTPQRARGQRAVVLQVGHRHQQQQADAVTDERGGHQQPGGGRGPADAGGDLGDERLDAEQVDDDEPDRSREQRRRAARQAICRRMRHSNGRGFGSHDDGGGGS